MARTVQEEATKLRQNLDRVYQAGYNAGAQTGGGGGYTEEDVNMAYARGFNEGTEEGIVTGKDIERNLFWETFQGFGSRTNYAYAFRYAYWTDDIFHPIHQIKGNCKQIFSSTNITHVDVPIIVDGDIDFGFQSANIKTISLLDLTNVDVISKAFNNNTVLESVSFLTPEDLANHLNPEYTGEKKYTIKVTGLDFSSCTKLSKESLLSLVYALDDKTDDTSGTEWIVTIGNTNKAKLTADELAVAVNKGWTVK